MNTDTCTLVSGAWVCSFEINTSQYYSFISTDGYSVTINTDALTSADITLTYTVWYMYFISSYACACGSDQFQFSFTAADPNICEWTSLTTDNALTGTTIRYLQNSGAQSYPMDSILSQTPSCGYIYFNYYVSETTTGDDLSSYGITIDQDSKVLLVNSEESPIVYDMHWWTTPFKNGCQTPIYFAFTLEIYCVLTSASAVTFFDSGVYEFFVDAATGFINFPTYTVEPSTCTVYTMTSIYSIDGVNDETKSWLTVTDTQFEIDATDPVNDIGTYTFHYQVVISDGVSFTETFTYTFDLTITCEVTSVAPQGSYISQTIVIFDQDTTDKLVTYTQSPACGETPVITFQYRSTLAVTTDPWINNPPFLTSDDDASTIAFQSSDYTIAGEYDVLQTTTLSSLTYTDNFVVLLTDPCESTIFVDETPDIYYAFIGTDIDPILIVIPTLTDDVNEFYGSDPLQSICGGQTVTLTEQGALPSYITASSSDFSVATDDESMVGEHTLDATVVLSRYPSLTTKIPVSIYLFLLSAPSPLPDISYLTSDTSLLFTVDLFTIAPPSDIITLTHIVTLSDGSSLPSFITYSELTNTLQFEVFSDSNANAGDYTVQITAVAVMASQEAVSVSLVVTFGIQVLESDEVVGGGEYTINLAPYFVEDLVAEVQVRVGDSFVYTLPEVEDSEEHYPVLVTVELLQASIFTQFDSDLVTLTIEPFDELQVGNYTLQITLEDSLGYDSQSTIQLEVISNTTTLDQDAEDTDSSASDEAEAFAVYAALQGWNWAEQLINAQIQRSKLNYQPLDPEVKFESISYTGLATLSFSKPMVVPPLDVLQNATFSINSKNFSAAHPFAIAGYYSSSENLTFNFNITEYSPRTLKMQLYFDHPLMVSMHPDSVDQLQIKFIGNVLFFDQDGLFIKKNTVIQKKLPTQLVLGGFAQLLAENQEQIETATIAVTTGTLLLNILLSASLQKLLTMVNTLQILEILALFNIQMPANVGLFFSSIMKIAEFDIIPTQDFYDDYIPASDEGIPEEVLQPLYSNFDMVGLESTLFIYNIGSVLTLIVLYPVLVLVRLAMRCLCCFCFKKICTNLQQRLSTLLFWNKPIITLVEAYSMLALCSFINLKQFDFEGATPVQKLSAILSVVFLLVVLALPIVLSTFLLKNFKHLNEAEYLRKYGILYTELRYTQSRSFIWEPVCFLLRRILLGSAVILQRNLIIQYLVITSTILAQVMVLTEIKPYSTLQQQKMSIFNEYFILLVVYSFMCFSQLVPDVQVRYDLGFICCGVVSVYLGLNIVLMVLSTGWQMQRRCKRRVLHRRLRKQNRVAKLQREQKQELELEFKTKNKTLLKIDRQQELEEIEERSDEDADGDGDLNLESIRKHTNISVAYHNHALQAEQVADQKVYDSRTKLQTLTPDTDEQLVGSGSERSLAGQRGINDYFNNDKDLQNAVISNKAGVKIDTQEAVHSKIQIRKRRVIIPANAAVFSKSKPSIDLEQSMKDLDKIFKSGPQPYDFELSSQAIKKQRNLSMAPSHSKIRADPTTMSFQDVRNELNQLVNEVSTNGQNSKDNTLKSISHK